MFIPDAQSTCEEYGGEMTSLTPNDFKEITNLLRLWHHKLYMGNIWLKSDVQTNKCNIIRVSSEFNK